MNTTLTFDQVKALQGPVLELMTEAITQARNVQPTELESIEAYKERLKLELQDQFATSLKQLDTGLEVLTTDIDETVARYAKTLKQHLGDIEKFYDEANKLAEEARPHFIGVATRLFESGDYHHAQDVACALAMLYPLDPHLTVIAGSLITEIDGRDTAVEFYDKIVQAFEHPMTHCFAADCFFEHGDKERAKTLLKRASAICDEEPKLAKAFRSMIDEFREELAASSI